MEVSPDMTRCPVGAKLSWLRTAHIRHQQALGLLLAVPSTETLFLQRTQWLTLTSPASLLKSHCYPAPPWPPCFKFGSSQPRIQILLPSSPQSIILNPLQHTVELFSWWLFVVCLLWANVTPRRQGPLLGLFTNGSWELTIGSGPWRPAMVLFFFFERLRSLYEGRESFLFLKGTLGLQFSHTVMNWKSPKYTVSITWAAPVPRNTVISHLRADNCLRAASLASFPRTFTVSALKAHLIPRILKGSGSMGAMFSPGILGEWEGIWIQNFLWTVSYLSPLGIFFPSFLPSFPPFFVPSFCPPSLPSFPSLFLKLKKKIISWLCCGAYWILVPRAGIEPRPWQ